MTTRKLRFTAELEYDTGLMHGASIDGKAWFL